MHSNLGSTNDTGLRETYTVQCTDLWEIAPRQIVLVTCLLLVGQLGDLAAVNAILHGVTVLFMLD